MSKLTTAILDVLSDGEWHTSKEITDRACVMASAKRKNVAVSERKQKRLEKEQRAAWNKRKADVKPLSHWMNMTQRAFNDYIRARDGNICISCGSTTAVSYHAGHYRTTAAASQLRFNEDNVDVFSMKSPLSGGAARSVKEVVHVICKTCNGKGVVSSSCRDCSGRGRAVLRKESQQQGVPVMGDCKQCGGRGFERIPSTEAFRAISAITDAISLATWEKSGKAFYEQLIGKLECEESWANAALSKVTG